MKSMIKIAIAMAVFMMAVAGMAMAAYVDEDTSIAPSADLSMGNKKITNVATPTNPADVSTKGYVDDHWGIGGGTAAVFMITADCVNKVNVPSGWNNINVITNLNNVEKDSMGGWDAANKRYVAQVAGKYVITGNVQWDNPWIGGLSYASVLKNGNLAFSGVKIQNSYAYGPVVTGIVDLDVGDYVQLSVCQDSGSTMQVSQWSQVNFQGFFLGL